MSLRTPVSQDSGSCDSVPRLDDLRRLQPRIWLSDLALDWACIAGFVWAYGQLDSLWLLPLASLAIGARLHAVALLGHDMTHRLVCGTRWLNDLGEVVTGWPLMLRVEGYRPWHFEHHRTLGSEYDPELSYRGDPVYAAPVSFGRVVLLFVTDLLGFGVPDLLKFVWQITPRRWTRMIPPVALWVTAFGVAYACGALWVPTLVLWSLLTGFWAVFRIRTWSEHVGAPDRGNESSHRFSAGPLARFLFFPHNTFCHYEHHRYPQVPYYALPELRQRIEDGPPVISLPELFRGIAERSPSVGATESRAG